MCFSDVDANGGMWMGGGYIVVARAALEGASTSDHPCAKSEVHSRSLSSLDFRFAPRIGNVSPPITRTPDYAAC